jgi:hypothetical protein
MSLPWNEQAPAVAAAVALFPGEFGLRGFPGEVFRVSKSASYYSTTYGVLLYTERKCEDGVWRDFAKGSPDELRAQIRR